ncbi:hypothetical protein ACH4D3_21685 [Streptomyces sp. NPDC018026]
MRSDEDDEDGQGPPAGVERAQVGGESLVDDRPAVVADGLLRYGDGRAAS